MFWAPSARDTKSLQLEVKIEHGVWIGFGAIILSGVTIGRRSIIAAGAIVTQDIPAQSMVSGVNVVIARRKAKQQT
ncbi:DapH/DapD/GlmU-related protein [Sphingomonas sp.]|uniref:DapH/DapD/GlmU-related protein n=1 Tax=Sphingomonas sp. TaxID=28214 RepID=UPI0035C7F13C